MKRKRQHQVVMNRLLRDERTQPRISALLQLLMMFQDSEAPEEKEFYKNVVVWAYGPDPKRINWTRPDDPEPAQSASTKHDAAMTQKAREVFGEIMEGLVSAEVD